MFGEDNSVTGILPPEVLLDIFKWLPKNDRLNCRFVCVRWSLLSAYGLNFLAKLTDETVNFVLNCSQRVETMFVRDLCRPLPLSSRRILLINFNFLQSVFFGANISRVNMTKLLEQAQAVKTLGFTGAISNFPIEATFRNLNCIQFQKMTNLSKKESRHFKSLLNKCHFPGLKRANFVNVNCSDFYLYLAIHRFVANHRDTLKNLIVNAEPKKIITGPVHERFRSLYESLNELKSVSTEIQDLQLDTLWINATNQEGHSPWILGLELLHSQNNLECLLLDGIWFWDAISGRHLQINDVIERNKRTLRRLKLPLLSFDCNLVRNCSFLTELGIYIHGDQLSSFGLSPWNGSLTNVQELPRSLRVLDLHLPIEKEKILWITQNLSIQEIVFEGLINENWDLSLFQRIWESDSLVKCRCWVKISRECAKELPLYYTETPGIEGQIMFNTRLGRALIEANFIREQQEHQEQPEQETHRQ